MICPVWVFSLFIYPLCTGSSRKYPSLPHRRNFVSGAPPLWKLQLIFIHFFYLHTFFFGLSEPYPANTVEKWTSDSRKYVCIGRLTEPPPPSSQGNSSPFCEGRGGSMDINFLETAHWGKGCLNKVLTKKKFPGILCTHSKTCNSMLYKLLYSVNYAGK